MIKWLKKARELKSIWPEIIYYYSLSDSEAKIKVKEFQIYLDKLYLFERRTYKWVFSILKKFYFKGD